MVAPGPEAQSSRAPSLDVEPGLDDLASADDLEPGSNTSAEALGALAAHTATTNGAETTPAAKRGAPAAAGSVAELFAKVRVKRSESGAIAIEAPPEAAVSLLALFEGMARLVRDGSAP